MKAASISELKKELARRDTGFLLETCLRLARFKKENKELMTYLLFIADNEQQYVASVRTEIEELFAGIKDRNAIYLVKKSLRKIVRTLNKFIRYSSVNTSEIEMRLHFCQCLRDSRIPMRKSRVIANMYNRQIKQTEKAILKLHEDMHSEYLADLRRLES